MICFFVDVVNLTGQRRKNVFIKPIGVTNQVFIILFHKIRDHPDTVVASG